MTGNTLLSPSARFTIRELVDEAQREAFMRRRYFEKSVKAGRMSRAEADRRIDMMEAIATRLLRTAHI